MATPHRYNIGQNVEIIPGRHDGSVPRGVYTVTRQLANDDADRDYRVKCKADGHERVVRESLMRPVHDPLMRG
jgi:hypothetical protein